MATPDLEKFSERLRKRDAEKALTARNHMALQRLRIATRRLREAGASVAAGILPPDSNLNIQQAQRDYKIAAADSSMAMRQLVDFILRGTVPEDLKF
jgi:hypothetical protein